MSESIFKFKQFSLSNGRAAQKVGTDGVLLGACTATGPKAPLRILDIGTGTGIVALMLAQRCLGSDGNSCSDGKLSEIIGIDIDSDAADEASDNFAASPWAASMRSEHISLCDFADKLNFGGADIPYSLRFDLIVCNPPYFDESLQTPDPKRNAARHTDSLSYREVVTFAGDALTDEGRLSLILPKTEEKSLIRFAASFGLFPQRIINIHTTASKPPKRVITEFSRHKGKVLSEEVTILCNGAYSPQYKELTKDFHPDMQEGKRAETDTTK